MSPDRLLKMMDKDGDGRISRSEFTGKKRPFSFFDSNNDGYATRQEIETAMGKAAAGGPTAGPDTRSGDKPEGKISLKAVGEEISCAIARHRRCDAAPAIARGLFETGLRPSFPDGIVCAGIDEHFAISYSSTRGREYYHGGIDMPANFGTPIIAIADGVVLTNISEAKSARGAEVIVRHTPKDTGIPLWIYSQYAHLNKPSPLQPGQRIRMGDVIGETGNSGSTPQGGMALKMRRPAIHFAIWYSDSPKYAIDKQGHVLPMDGWWMDPTALYRLTPPFDSVAMKALPENEKFVKVPVRVEGGGTLPTSTRLIWPYACKN
ncbi:MAG: peptidoglycan DD-metalloendopeptidase family protein [Rhodospirillales bacterium]